MSAHTGGEGQPVEKTGRECESLKGRKPLRGPFKRRQRGGVGYKKKKRKGGRRLEGARVSKWVNLELPQLASLTMGGSNIFSGREKGETAA